MQQRFLLQILLLAQHVSGTTMPIIRSSTPLYSGCCLWYLVLWFSSCWSDVGLIVVCPVCRTLQHNIWCVYVRRTHTHQMLCCRITTLTSIFLTNFKISNFNKEQMRSLKMIRIRSKQVGEFLSVLM